MCKRETTVNPHTTPQHRHDDLELSTTSSRSSSKAKCIPDVPICPIQNNIICWKLAVNTNKNNSSPTEQKQAKTHIFNDEENSEAPLTKPRLSLIQRQTEYQCSTDSNNDIPKKRPVSSPRVSLHINESNESRKEMTRKRPVSSPHASIQFNEENVSRPLTPKTTSPARSNASSTKSPLRKSKERASRESVSPKNDSATRRAASKSRALRKATDEHDPVTDSPAMKPTPRLSLIQRQTISQIKNETAHKRSEIKSIPPYQTPRDTKKCMDTATNNAHSSKKPVRPKTPVRAPTPEKHLENTTSVELPNPIQKKTKVRHSSPKVARSETPKRKPLRAPNPSLTTLEKSKTSGTPKPSQPTKVNAGRIITIRVPQMNECKGDQKTRRPSSNSPTRSPRNSAKHDNAGEFTDIFHKKNKAGFVPTLQNIKSSNLLLEGKLQEEKPAKLNNEARKKMLEESRRKFKSKEYLQEAKYEKIEGLNWISWNN